MKCNEIKSLFPDYLTGDLDLEQSESLRNHTASCESCRTELEEITSTWTRLGVLPEEQPGPNLRENFYSMLESYEEKIEKKKSFSLKQLFKNLLPVRPAVQWAFTLIFIVAAFTSGYFIAPGTPGQSPEDRLQPQEKTELLQLRNESRQMRQQLTLALLTQESPSQRLKGLTFSSTVKEPGKPMLEALLYTLNNDPNVNVRLSAVDALYLFATHPMVKKGIAESLPKQESPLVQMALIDLVTELREKQAAESLKKLIEQKKLNPHVRKKAKNSLEQFI